MKQTAVEWLIENSHIIPKSKLNKKELIEQAKEIYKQQIIEAVEFGNDYNNPVVIDGEEYYDKIFK